MFCQEATCVLLTWYCQNIPFSDIPPQRSHCACFLCITAITVKCDKYQNASSFLRGCIRSVSDLEVFTCANEGKVQPFFSLLEGVFLPLTFPYGGMCCFSQPDNAAVTFNLFVSVLHQSSQHCKPSFFSKYFSLS